MKAELLRQLLSPRPTLHDVAAALRVTVGGEAGERAVGEMYGGWFKKLEAVYDAAGGRWTRETAWLRRRYQDR